MLSMMADECTDIATIEELSILTLKRCDAETVYSTLVEWLKKNCVPCQKMVWMGFDGASTFARKHSGIQARLNHMPSSSTATATSFS